MWISDGIRLVSADGVTIPEFSELPYRGYAINIPVGFDGWVFIPFTCMKIHCADAANGGSQINFDAVFDMPSFCGTAIGDEETFAILEIDNLFLSSAELPEIEEEPSDDDDEQESTADVSVLAYAAAAITGLGALVVAKKR